MLVEEPMYHFSLDFRCSPQERDGSIVCRLGRFTRLGHRSNDGISPLGFLQFVMIGKRGTDTTVQVL